MKPVTFLYDYMSSAPTAFQHINKQLLQVCILHIIHTSKQEGFVLCLQEQEILEVVN